MNTVGCIAVSNPGADQNLVDHVGHVPVNYKQS